MIDSNKSVSSTGAFAPANVSGSVIDPLARFRSSSTAIEPAEWVRLPIPVKGISTATPQDRDEPVAKVETKILTPASLGWTRDFTMSVRESLASFAEEWDDPSMDVYDGR